LREAGVCEASSSESDFYDLFSYTQNRDEKIVAVQLLTITGLDEERQKTLEQLEKFSSLLKGPDNAHEDFKPTQRYTLRGAAVADGSFYETTYTLVDPTHKAATDDAMEDSFREEEQAQWWKMRYSTIPYITTEKVSQETVLKAASEGSRDVLLVYASDAASEPREISLPDSLKAFVDQDNKYFKEELDGGFDTADVPQDYSNNADWDAPPAYESLDARWPAEDRSIVNGSWEPDPGEEIVGDDDYRVSTEYDYQANMSSNSAPSGDWDGSSGWPNGGMVVESIEKDPPANLGNVGPTTGLQRPSENDTRLHVDPRMLETDVKHIEDIEMKEH
jgi:hypothetical protein